MHLTLARTVPAVSDPADPSPRVLEVAAMFGLGLDASRAIEIVPPTPLTLRAGQVVFITGPSGGGKSTLLRLIREAIPPVPGVIDLEALPEPADVPLVDAMGDMPLDAALRLLTLAGLGDAFVMLRRPAELSDGQRCRFRLARAFALAEAAPQVEGRPPVILADELGATLDRTTAATVARGVRKWATRSGACFIAATTHDDLLEPLSPDVLIEKGLGAAVEVVERASEDREAAKARREGHEAEMRWAANGRDEESQERSA